MYKECVHSSWMNWVIKKCYDEKWWWHFILLYKFCRRKVMIRSNSIRWIQTNWNAKRTNTHWEKVSNPKFIHNVIVCCLKSIRNELRLAYVCLSIYNICVSVCWMNEQMPEHTQWHETWDHIVNVTLFLTEWKGLYDKLGLQPSQISLFLSSLASSSSSSVIEQANWIVCAPFTDDAPYMYPSTNWAHIHIYL